MDQNHEISRIAYELYLMRNGAPGDPVADWIMAERIYAERKAQSASVELVQETALAPSNGDGATVDATMSAPAAKQVRARKTAAKKQAAAPVKEEKKAEVKAAPVKEEKKAEEPKKKTVRRKTASKE